MKEDNKFIYKIKVSRDRDKVVINKTFLARNSKDANNKMNEYFSTINHFRTNKNLFNKKEIISKIDLTVKNINKFAKDINECKNFRLKYNITVYDCDIDCCCQCLNNINNKCKHNQ